MEIDAAVPSWLHAEATWQRQEPAGASCFQKAVSHLLASASELSPTLGRWHGQLWGFTHVPCLTQQECTELTSAWPACLSCTGGMAQAALVALKGAQPSPLELPQAETSWQARVRLRWPCSGG